MLAIITRQLRIVKRRQNNMDEKKTMTDALIRFIQQYPDCTDDQKTHFVFGFEACWPHIEKYKYLCKLVDVPELLIEHPYILDGKPSKRFIDWAKTIIEIHQIFGDKI